MSLWEGIFAAVSPQAFQIFQYTSKLKVEAFLLVWPDMWELSRISFQTKYCNKILLNYSVSDVWLLKDFPAEPQAVILLRRDDIWGKQRSNWNSTFKIILTLNIACTGKVFPNDYISIFSLQFFISVNNEKVKIKDFFCPCSCGFFHWINLSHCVFTPLF